MPFKNAKQRSWMFANKPELAKNWTKKYKSKLKKGKKKNPYARYLENQ